MTENDLVLYQINVIILIWIKGMAWGYAHTFANSEKIFEPQMRIKLATLRVLVWMVLPLSYWKVHQTFRIALGTCSKFGRPPPYRPKTVYLYNWNNVYLFSSKRSYEKCLLLDEHITLKSCQISKFAKIILSKGKWWHWTSKAKLKVDLNFLVKVKANWEWKSYLGNQVLSNSWSCWLA